MPRGYSLKRTNVHVLHYHFILCSKYRRKDLIDEVASRLESFVEEYVNGLELEIIELTIQPDYVHLFSTGHPDIATYNVTQQIKGFSSRIHRVEADFGLPTLWTRSYLVSPSFEESSQTFEAQTG